jgi:two-component system sensor kinase FixL
MFGYRAEEMVGRSVNELMTSRDSHHHDDYMSRYMQTGERRIIGIGRIVKARRANGEEFPVDLKIGEAVIGEHRLFTGYLRDLTEQQAVELRMKQMQAELVHFSRVSAVGTMAAALAHELNQPLTAISNYLEAGRDLLDDPSDEDVKIVRDALAEAAHQSLRAGEIVRKLRDFVTKGEIDAKPVELGPLLADSIALAKLDRRHDGVRIDSIVEGDPGHVMAEPVQVQQVIFNLMRNAMDAMNEQSDARITLQAEPCEDEDFIEVWVADNGPGIPEDVAVGLFDSFNSSKAAGMGLGLSICKLIVEAHGGEIDVVPSPLGGGAFRFTLKRA